MRIDVRDMGDHFDDQTRAYAEYRVFSTLVTLGDVVHTVGVGLARAADAVDPSTSREVFACSVSIRLHSGHQMDVASHAQHPYEAIDRAAHRIAAVVHAHALTVDAPASGR